MPEVDDILTDWGLESLISIFRDNKIDIHVFKKLTPSYIARLIPTIGDQLIFEEQWNLKYAEKKSEENAEACSEKTSDVCTKTLSATTSTAPEEEEASSGEALQEKLSKADATRDGNDTESEKENERPKKRKKNRDQSANTKRKCPSSETDDVDESSQENSSMSDESASLSDSNDASTQLRCHKRRKAFVGHQEFAKRIKEEDPLSVKAILRKSAVGKCLLLGYKKSKHLNTKSRRILVDLVISANVIDENSVIHRDQFERMSRQIVKLFPSESESSYYIPPVPKHLSRYKKSEVSKGKLVDKFRNKIKEYRAIAGVCRKKNKPDTDNGTEVTEEIGNSIQWLKHNADAPLTEVLVHWEKTARYRWDKLQKSNTSIADHIIEWPIFAKSIGHKLIDADFRLIWNDQHAAIYTRWNGFFSKLRNVRYVTSPNAKLLESIIDDEEMSEHSKILAQILLLSYYVPPKGRIQRKGQHWKPSITECQESIVIHVKEVGDISELRRDRVNKMAAHGLTVQPYMFAVGPTLQEIKDYYIVIDQSMYRVDSPLRAFDICFKSFHVFNALYPPESEHIYLLLQFAVYDFTTKWDKQISYIVDIVKQVK